MPWCGFTSVYSASDPCSLGLYPGFCTVSAAVSSLIDGLFCECVCVSGGSFPRSPPSVSWANGHPIRSYIPSYIPLQLRVTMWLNSSQWDTTRKWYTRSGSLYKRQLLAFLFLSAPSHGLDHRCGCSPWEMPSTDGTEISRRWVPGWSLGASSTRVNLLFCLSLLFGLC